MFNLKKYHPFKFPIAIIQYIDVQESHTINNISHRTIPLGTFAKLN